MVTFFLHIILYVTSISRTTLNVLEKNTEIRLICSISRERSGLDERMTSVHSYYNLPLLLFPSMDKSASTW